MKKQFNMSVNKANAQNVFAKAIFLVITICLLAITRVTAHPGSGIVVDKAGNVYFTDTGKGVWKIDNTGKLSFMPSSRFHWMAIDEEGIFSNSPKSFGGYFERVTELNAKPTIIISSDFKITMNPDGNMYYIDHRSGYTRLMRRTAAGKETVVLTDKSFEFTGGICSGPDGSLYITEGGAVGSNKFRKISLDGKISNIATYAGKISKDLPTGALDSYCRGLDVDPAGNIFVAATGSRRILRVSPTGEVKTLLEVQSPWVPTSLAIFKGEVYILEWHDVAPELEEVREAWVPRVRKIGRDGNVVTLATVKR
jgi:sugar lactone lactonase YvrE